VEQLKGATDTEGRVLFLDPIHKFRPSAYWFWHSIPDEETCRRQLADFKARGLGTILIQARIALPREDYMSDAYLAAYRLAIGIAAELGLKAGIYDDYNWISGHAGGRTVEGRDELRERHLFWSSSKDSKGAISGIQASFTERMGPEIFRWQYEGSKVEWCEWTLEAALLHPAGAITDLDQITDVTKAVRITASDPVSCRFEYDGAVQADQALTVFVSARSTTSRLINYLMPEAAARFIEVGLDPFTEALDGLVPDPLGSIFYDQPAAGFYRWDQIEGNPGNSLLFSSKLSESVASRTCVLFPVSLMAVLHDVGEQTRRLRAQFYAAYSSLMNEAFFGTLRDWAERNGIALTGHEILPHISSWSLNGGFTSIDPRVAPAVDFFGIDSFRHETAVDSNNFDPQLAPKLGDSVARSNGRSRCVVETYASAVRTPVRAAGQWELTLETMRAQAIRLHCLGMRQFLWHGVYQTDGRNGDPTPFANPRFDYGPGINFEPWWTYHDIFAQESARISIFIEPAVPRTPVAILYPVHTAWAEGPRHSHADHVGAWCEHLLALGYDFMLVSESDIANAEIDGGRIVASGLAFEAVVLPSVTVLESGAALKKLARFKDAGGSIWSSGDRLLSLCEGSLEAYTELATTHLPRLPEPRTMAELLAAIAVPGPQIRSLSGAKPWQWVGEEPGGHWRVVLFNDASKTIRCEISHGKGFNCEVWCPADGTAHSTSAYGCLTITLELQEVRCLRLYETDQPVETQGHLTSPPAFDDERAVVLGEGWTFAPDADAAFVPISVLKGWEEQGFAAFSGTGIYRLDMKIAAEDDWIVQIPEAHTAVTVRIDGREVGRRAWRPYRFMLGHLTKGAHELEIAVSNTAANRYYDHTPYLGSTLDKSGLTAAPRLVPLTRES